MTCEHHKGSSERSRTLNTTLRSNKDCEHFRAVAESDVNAFNLDLSVKLRVLSKGGVVERKTTGSKCPHVA